MTFARFPAGLRAEPRPSCRILAEPSQLPATARSRGSRQALPPAAASQLWPLSTLASAITELIASRTCPRRENADHHKFDLSGCWKFERRRFFEGVLQGVCRGRQFCIFSQAAKLLQFRPRRPNLGDMLVAQPKTSILSQRARDLSALHKFMRERKAMVYHFPNEGPSFSSRLRNGAHHRNPGSIAAWFCF
jgi:hypothetical protein